MTNVDTKPSNVEANALQGSLNILIADDHRLLGEAVANLLRAGAGFYVKTAETYDETVKAINSDTVFDIVLLDLKMPGMVGLDSVKAIVERSSPARVVLFTGQIDRHFLNSALDIGVRGLIPKTMPLQSLTSVIQLINSGQVFVPMQELNAAGESSAGTDAKLSEKELFVLRLAADGMTNKEIARDMGATEVTVKMHMRSICKKLGARNRAHAAIISRELALF
ncbi:response regulator [Pseudoprimorskyibacter insulae]|uniref:Transcriptional regulatory protein DegU n=1 Tax=Pseudoprimorskyibacter insulae TaxID=1695997 RepID=A0A2R8AVX8_9RHOB|nr:response regulator transcription factor [Pseudoprimorskyibacter insulae]SPF80054.1 Transcriptional regulatory protein DegU [Pseudoprimorskyibacter insulae]